MDHSPTVLDLAHAAMMAAPEDDAARLRYYARLADGMLYLMLEAEAVGGVIRPRIFALQDGPVVLAFDREDRLAEAAGGVVPYAELSGRVIAAELAGQTGQPLSLGINLGVADSAFLVPPEALLWLSQVLSANPSEVSALPIAFAAPRGLPVALLTALDAKLARAAGLAQSALLACVTYDGGRIGHMLAFVGARPGAEAALARAANEALTFSGVEAGEMDVTFLAEGDTGLAALAQVALRFDLPHPEVTAPQAPQAPGTDPSRPPILR